MEASQDSRNTAMLMYILTIFFGFIPPLIFFFVKKDDRFVYENAAELLNFVITTIVAGIALIIIAIILAFIPIVGPIVVLLLYFAFAIGILVLLIMGTLKVKEGISYKFPFAIRLIKV
ncbi:MAG: DUF4870 domain-containing protein [Methylobacillus sp.]|jgi:uncharacterized Tic20 family protein|nr:DUF4870 domain-containing protein [Methylobacillus sp.]